MPSLMVYLKKTANVPHKDYVDTHSETALLAFAIKMMTVAGFTDNNDDVSKHLLLSGVSLVNSIAMAKSQTGGSASLAKQ